MLRGNSPKLHAVCDCSPNQSGPGRDRGASNGLLLGGKVLKKSLGVSANRPAIVLRGVRMVAAILKAALTAVDEDKLIIRNDQPAVGTLIDVESDGCSHGRIMAEDLT